jgi:hypothetical protein
MPVDRTGAVGRDMILVFKGAPPLAGVKPYFDRINRIYRMEKRMWHHK